MGAILNGVALYIYKYKFILNRQAVVIELSRKNKTVV